MNHVEFDLFSRAKFGVLSLLRVNEGARMIDHKPSLESISFTQRAEAILNKISNNINEIYTGLISVLQGFQKCIA